MPLFIHYICMQTQLHKLLRYTEPYDVVTLQPAYYLGDGEGGVSKYQQTVN